jgi:hypothetical protein
MNTAEKMAEVRERFSLPEPGAQHNCTAIQDGPSEREQRLSRPHPCYNGQWTIHGEHDYDVKVQNWLGGGTAKVHCPGKTEETVLG